MTDEEELLQRLRNREKNSIDEAIRIYTPYLSTVLYHMAGNSLPKEDIEEIVADVFVVLWKNTGRIDLQKGTLRSYLAAVARNFALKRINRKMDHTSLEDIELSDGKNFMEENFHNNYVWETVMSLGEPDSEIFVRRYKFDEKIKDISKAMGLNISTVKTRLSRGKRKLRKNVIGCGGKIMRRKNLLKELGIQKQADASLNALDIDTENVRQRVYAKLDFADTERKQTTMRSKKKILPLLIAATLTIGVTAMAATGKISMWTGSSASRADYTSLPTSEQITKDIGYRPVLIDTFENGYCFKEGNIIKNSFKDGNANVIENFKSVSFDYQKNGDVVSFEQQKFNSKLTPSGDIIATVNGTNLYYVHYINKVVSNDYELTEQDKKDQSSGKVIFSYNDSASQIEVSQVQSVNWNKDGIQYDLLQIDGKLSAGELADMAREVINNRR